MAGKRTGSVLWLLLLLLVIQDGRTCVSECELSNWYPWECNDCCKQGNVAATVYRHKSICCSNITDPYPCVNHCRNIGYNVTFEDTGLCQQHCTCNLTSTSLSPTGHIKLSTGSSLRARVSSITVPTTDVLSTTTGTGVRRMNSAAGQFKSTPPPPGNQVTLGVHGTGQSATLFPSTSGSKSKTDTKVSGTTRGSATNDHKGNSNMRTINITPSNGNHVTIGPPSVDSSKRGSITSTIPLTNPNSYFQRETGAGSCDDNYEDLKKEIAKLETRGLSWTIPLIVLLTMVLCVQCYIAYSVYRSSRLASKVNSDNTKTETKTPLELI